MTLTDWAHTQTTRCQFGFAPTQHPQLCECEAPDEWSVFKRAVLGSVRRDGTVHQADVRPRIRGRIEPKHIGTMWRRAKDTGLLVDTGEREPSNDAAGRNTDKLDRIYRRTER